MRASRLFAFILLVILGAACYVWFWPLRDPHPAPPLVTNLLVIRSAKIYTSADDLPLENASILIKDGTIIAIGKTLALPAGAQEILCQQCIVTPGFWNTHVHFTEPKWDFAAWKSKRALNEKLQDMFTSRGFTTVVDAGSDLRTTVSLRRRIEQGDLIGPTIYTAGSPLYPPDGIPYYLKDSLPFLALLFMAQPASPQEAAKIEESNIARGADLLKLFTGSYIARGQVKAMPRDIASAAVEVAHRNQQIVYSHASNAEGVRVALNSGVNVLAHAPDTTDGIDDNLLQQLAEHHVAMIPTLKMFATTVTTNPKYLDPIYSLVRKFHQMGGRLMFGTDVGYMTDYSTQDEFAALAQCGLDYRDILRMLTATPANEFGVGARLGALAPGMQADLTILDSDPAKDISAFSKVRLTLRRGQILYSRKP